LSNQTTLNPPNDVNGETCFSNQPQQYKHQQQSQSKNQQLVFHMIASDELETVETTVCNLKLDLNEFVNNNNNNESPTQAQMKSADTSIGCTNENHVLTTTERRETDDSKMRKRDNIIFVASNEMTIRERGVCFDGNRLKNNKNHDKSNFSLLSATIRHNQQQHRKQQFDNIDREIKNNGLVVGGADASADGTQFPSVEKLIKMYASLVNDQMPVESHLKKTKISKSVVEKNSEMLENNAKAKVENIAIEVGELEFIEQFDRQMNIGQEVKEQQQHLFVSERRKSPASDEGFSVQMSPYGSSDEEECNKYKAAEKVTRSTSSDSALGIEEEAIQPTINEKPVPKRRRATLTVNDIPLRPALLPVALPISLPTGDLLSPTSSDGNSPTVVRSRILLEEQLIEIPNSETDDFDTAPVAPLSSTMSATNSYPSRRESTVSDFDGVVRSYVRTPSVVLSDYCDEMMGGITL
jgi:hypothetical protein